MRSNITDVKSLVPAAFLMVLIGAVPARSDSINLTSPAVDEELVDSQTYTCEGEVNTNKMVEEITVRLIYVENGNTHELGDLERFYVSDSFSVEPEAQKYANEVAGGTYYVRVTAIDTNNGVIAEVDRRVKVVDPEE